MELRGIRGPAPDGEQGLGWPVAGQGEQDALLRGAPQEHEGAPRGYHAWWPQEGGGEEGVGAGWGRGGAGGERPGEQWAGGERAGEQWAGGEWAGERAGERAGGEWAGGEWAGERSFGGPVGGRLGGAGRGQARARRAGASRPANQVKPVGKLRRAWQRVVSALAATAAFLAKFGALLLKLKYIGLVLSMGISVVAYTLFFGWSFAIGFVLLIFVHEMGHVIVLRRQGVPASAPLFIPFLGAFVNMRQMPRNAYQEAVSGLAGPYFGTAASAAVAVWGHAVGSDFLLQLGALGFLVNLFNLLPVLPLDGGRAAAALHPVLWLVGLAGLLVWEFYNPSPIALIILVLGGYELFQRWTRRNSPAAVAYHALATHQRVSVAAMYVLVVAVGVAGFQLTYVARGL